MKVKKLIPVLLLILWSNLFQLKAQSYSFYADRLYMATYNPRYETSKNPHGVKQISTKAYKGQKEKKEREQVSEFLPSGEILRIEHPYTRETDVYTWQNKKMQSHLRLKKGDTVYYVLSAFDEAGNEISRCSYGKSVNKLESKWLYTYGADHRLLSMERYNGNGKILSRYENDYNEKGERTESRYYRKGKLKRVTSFMCNSKGITVAASVEQNKICSKHTSNPDGTFINVQEITLKGKIMKNVYTFSADSNLIVFEQYDVKGKRTVKINREYNADHKVTLYTQYNAKDKLELRIENTFNEKYQLTEQKVFKQNKAVYREVYTYTFYLAEAN